MRFVFYKHWTQLPDSANVLFAENEHISLFCSKIWLETLSTHALAEHQTLLLACVIEKNGISAILPLIKHSQGDLSSLSNNFTSVYSLLISNNDQQDAILDCLAHGLSQELAHPILFEPIDTLDHKIIRLRQLMESYGFQSYPYFRFYNWVHPVKGQSFNEYMADRPSILRNTIRRKQHKLNREHTYHIRLFKNAETDNSQINKALADYHAIYKTSWKSNEYFSEFTPALIKNLHLRNWLRLAILYINEQPAAAQIWFVAHGKAYIYRLAYDENWRHYSPGSILTKYLMRYVIDIDKVTEIDFLTGNERYKQDWMTVRKERIGIRFAKSDQEKNKFSRTFQPLKNLFSIS